MTERVPSPCISICALDSNDICIGCARSGQEIINWGKMSNDERKEVLKKTVERQNKQYVNLGQPVK